MRPRSATPVPLSAMRISAELRIRARAHLGTPGPRPVTRSQVTCPQTQCKSLQCLVRESGSRVATADGMKPMETKKPRWSGWMLVLSGLALLLIGGNVLFETEETAQKPAEAGEPASVPGVPAPGTRAAVRAMSDVTETTGYVPASSITVPLPVLEPPPLAGPWPREVATRDPKVPDVNGSRPPRPIPGLTQQ